MSHRFDPPVTPFFSINCIGAAGRFCFFAMTRMARHPESPRGIFGPYQRHPCPNLYHRRDCSFQGSRVPGRSPRSTNKPAGLSGHRLRYFPSAHGKIRSGRGTVSSASAGIMALGGGTWRFLAVLKIPRGRMPSRSVSVSAVFRLPADVRFMSAARCFLIFPWRSGMIPASPILRALPEQKSEYCSDPPPAISGFTPAAIRLLRSLKRRFAAARAMPTAVTFAFAFLTAVCGRSGIKKLLPVWKRYFRAGKKPNECAVTPAELNYFMLAGVE